MIFEVKDGAYGFGNEIFFENLNFTIGEGETLAVLGPNGIGKTTLLKCMMGLKPWLHGESRIDGTPLQKLSQKEIWTNIGYVAQAKNVNFTYTAKEMVLLGRSAHLGVFAQPRKEDVEIAERAMEMVGITHLAHKNCHQMSGGQLQMVLIARSLASNPKMLIMDEPESNLDFKNQLIILDTIEKLAQEHQISCIINTHYPAHALRVAHKSLILCKNKEWFWGESKKVINEVNMEKAFDVKVAIESLNIQGEQHTYVVPVSFTK